MDVTTIAPDSETNKELDFYETAHRTMRSYGGAFVSLEELRDVPKSEICTRILYNQDPNFKSLLKKRFEIEVQSEFEDNSDVIKRQVIKIYEEAAQYLQPNSPLFRLLEFTDNCYRHIHDYETAGNVRNFARKHDASKGDSIFRIISMANGDDFTQDGYEDLREPLDRLKDEYSALLSFVEDEFKLSIEEIDYSEETFGVEGNIGTLKVDFVRQGIFKQPEFKLLLQKGHLTDLPEIQHEVVAWYFRTRNLNPQAIRSIRSDKDLMETKQYIPSPYHHVVDFILSTPDVAELIRLQ